MTPPKGGDSGRYFTAITPHDEYFLSGGDLYIMVDHVQFRVHRFFFERESPYFRSMLTGPASPGAHKPGTAESTAIILDELKPTEFARFLWVFYNPKYSIYNASVDDWTGILTLAHRWAFHEVKALAVRELEKLDSPDIDRIVTYHDCQVDRNLLIHRYAALCQREEPLTLEEANRLGMQTTVNIVTAREYARGPVLSSGLRSPVAANIGLDEIIKVIRGAFSIPAPIEPVAPSDPTSLATTNGGTTAPPQSNQLETSSVNQDPKGHDRNNSSVTTLNGASASATTTTQNANATSSAPEQPPQPPSKNEAPNGKLEKTAGPLGPGAGTSNDGNKDSTKEKDKNTPSTDKDPSKDAHKSTTTNADVGGGRSSGGMLHNIITSVTGQKSDLLLDLPKVEEPNGRHSPMTPRNTNAKQRGSNSAKNK
ncbi:hypothetical protein APHAL10511_000636 [Amanita phalloides]|nr:hypothetical protein APHAL10511_000636 [Amanita phalloides]